MSSSDLPVDGIPMVPFFPSSLNKSQGQEFGPGVLNGRERLRMESLPSHKREFSSCLKECLIRCPENKVNGGNNCHQGLP
ncbi:hypothetical protein TNCV_1210991 [Trichonephila clavipes]|uniref:Uncharacterized protein n=2 Tax=Trichonephila TaxID=2585208 RepID=A0A8X6FPP3_TRICU|nr:hypothetical protein TNCT_309801 [Trichonephila clavata]GFW13633.1 hypothetical protein TNCV_1210991 [Trichonephila clavipes]GFY40955.1 hypothetical protein TNIN_365231 [Trichonephila inaurata madagascariensis]